MELRHVDKPNTKQNFPHKLTRAHGSCMCRRRVGTKGVPVVEVPFDSKLDCIELILEGWLVERWCSTSRGDTDELRAPGGLTVKVQL